MFPVGAIAGLLLWLINRLYRERHGVTAGGVLSRDFVLRGGVALLILGASLPLFMAALQWVASGDLAAAPWVVGFGILAFPGPLSRRLLVPLGLPRLAFALASIPTLGWARDREGGAILTAVWALHRCRHPAERQAAWIESRLARCRQLGGAGVVASAMAAAWRGELETAWCLLWAVELGHAQALPALARCRRAWRLGGGCRDRRAPPFRHPLHPLPGPGREIAARSLQPGRAAAGGDPGRGVAARAAPAGDPAAAAPRPACQQCERRQRRKRRAPAADLPWRRGAGACRLSRHRPRPDLGSGARRPSADAGAAAPRRRPGRRARHRRGGDRRAAAGDLRGPRRTGARGTHPAGEAAARRSGRSSRGGQGRAHDPARGRRRGHRAAGRGGAAAGRCAPTTTGQPKAAARRSAVSRSRRCTGRSAPWRSGCSTSGGRGRSPMPSSNGCCTRPSGSATPRSPSCSAATWRWAYELPSARSQRGVNGWRR